jgi:hypothetical protein
VRRAEFSDNIGAEIVSAMQNLKQTRTVSADVTFVGGKWTANNTGCYAYMMDALKRANHPDHFGIVYKTFNAKPDLSRDPAPVGRTCYSWLQTLLNPEGVFAGVLPFLWHKTPKEIIRDKGFVLHSMLAPECNPGLVWTFLLASRMLWEHHHERKLWDDIRKNVKDKDIALFLTLALARSAQGFGIGYKGHGQPVVSPWIKARSFLQHDFQKWPTQGPNGSSGCFKNDNPVGISATTVLTLDKWVQKCNEVKNGKAA